MRRVCCRSLALGGACLFAAMLVGCRDGNTPGGALGTSVPDAEAAIADVAGSSEEVPLVVAGWEETQAMIAQQRGKVVVVDLWNTW
ncbi:MAG: hypothetical protein ACC628_28100 [Pirellulaceae bacterium]